MSDSAWLGNSAPVIKNESTTVARIPHGNRECVDISALTCVVRTSYGYFGNELRLNSTSFPYPVISSFGDGKILPIPNSDTVIVYHSHPSNGEYLYFTKGFSTSLKLKLSSGKLRYESDKPPNARLRDKAGSLLLAPDFDSITFSKNGKWMLIPSGAGILRVNLETFEVLPFGPKFRFDPGTNPFLQSAISNNGRYAVIASSKNAGFKVYDLNTCGSVPNVILDPVQCEFKELFGSIAAKVPGATVGITYVRFLDEDTLNFYVIHNTGTGGANQITKYSLNADSTNSFDYLALGDSYISGEGISTYKDGTDIRDNRCHLSYFSYPYLIGNLLDWNQFESVACSGAKNIDITDTSPGYNEDSQATGKESDSYDYEIYDNFLPGYRAQIGFVTKYRPARITISIGGNDIGFSGIIKRCIGTDTCYRIFEDRLELVRQINSRFEAFAETYQKIKDSAPSSTKIYVIGYPQIAKVGGDCGLNVHLDAKEVDFAEKLITYLNKVLKSAASYAGVLYVDSESAFRGYRLCETDGKNTAVNGLTAGNDAPIFPGPFGKESYHPNSLGHDLLKEKILSLTKNLTLAMPAPDLTATPPSENNLDILNVGKSGRQTFTTYYDDGLTNEVQERGGVWGAYISGIKYSLKPFSNFKAVLNSEPIQLGGFMTNGNGDLDIQIQTPTDIPPGFHTLHLYGQNIEGTAIDIYKTTYVAASFSDLDGDGIPNSSDACVAIEPSGTDYDKDGVDDACDGQITEPPSTPNNNVAASLNHGTALIPGRMNQTVISPIQVQENSNNFAFSGSVFNEESPKSHVLGANTVSPTTSNSKESPAASRDISSMLLVGLGIVAGSSLFYRYQRRA